MRLGGAELQLISGGSFRMDGGDLFGEVPKTLWSKLVPLPRHLPPHYATAYDIYPLEPHQPIETPIETTASVRPGAIQGLPGPLFFETTPARSAGGWDSP